MLTKPNRRRKLTITILSLSLLTVMAGAAVAPALNTIKEYFYDTNQALTQMVISIPALFIVIMSPIFPKLCRKVKSKTLLMAGLLLYVIGGCLAGIFNNIFLVLAFRALVGIGVGIIMPMSTGLISFYYTRDKQDKLMGFSSAMNQFGGVVATLISGLLATISWRLSFLVYAIGLFVIVLCIIFLPNEHIVNEEEKRETGVFKQYYSFIIALFLLMFTFFIYPTEFAIESSKEGILPQQYIAIVMAGMDLIAFLGGLAFYRVKKMLSGLTKLVSPILFFIGYGLLFWGSSLLSILIGSAFIGFANGIGVPFILSTASQQAGKSAAVTVMPLLSMALYLAQFVTPIILSVISELVGKTTISQLPYLVATISAFLFCIWSLTIKSNIKEKHKVNQE